ncbi:uncharacterized protein LY89DRAFT_718796 [Mollisia scopiformis]|uniref:Uncharacterized protein n=1 Tax=Mollisia scopiformis TaxID=149040 RepID=A0A194XAD0_MOLSC|nr:uncharacterized protein LY89DRAFT_718796 [Mollisia scopiformis]KUJ17125.1 hypothetical protein LY89DRAFT_718796 [Mollisia scopiformis]
MFDEGNYSSEPEEVFLGSSSASDIISSDSSQGRRRSAQSRRLGSQLSERRVTPSDTGRTSYSWSSFASRLSTCSTGSVLLSHPSTASFLGVTPYFSAPRKARESSSWASSSSHFDPILENLALGTPPASAAASPPRHISRPSSLSSSEADESQESDSSAEPNGVDAAGALGTPPTSDATSDAAADEVFVTDQDFEDQIVVIPIVEALYGLLTSGPDEHYVESVSNDEDEIDAREDILNGGIGQLREYANLQTRGSEEPWTPGTQEVELSWGSSIVAPSAGRVYNLYHSKTGVYKARHDSKVHKKKKKAILANRDSEDIDGLVSGTSSSEDRSDSRSRRTSDHYEISVECSQICRGLGCSQFSPETLTSLFYPQPFFSHLTINSLDIFQRELIAPNSLNQLAEYAIDLSLGFGPPIPYQVCAFIPNKKEALRSFQKFKDDEPLHMQESLPIVVNLFEAESHAGDIDAWLETLIDSESGLREYVELVERKKKGDPAVKILRCIVQWYQASKNDISEGEHRTSRATLKLLMTTTLLTNVPRVQSIPEPLRQLIHPQPVSVENPHISPLGPKLLTRQIKASIHYLQHELLHAIFCYLECNLNLTAEVKVAIALLVAIVLELAQSASRQFAKFASKINQKVVVDDRDVTRYETDMRTQVFNRVRASICGIASEIGYLGEMLKGLGSLVVGNGKEKENFVSVILNDVL